MTQEVKPAWLARIPPRSSMGILEMFVQLPSSINVLITDVAVEVQRPEVRSIT